MSTSPRKGSMIAPNLFRNSKRKLPYSDEWYTPSEIPLALGSFDLDPCAGPSHHARRNIRRPKDGLAAIWIGRVWLNPPYSNIHEWLDRLAAHGNGICLVNMRPETVWFQEMMAGASAVLWLRGRVRFIAPEWQARTTASRQRAGSLRPPQREGPGAERLAGHHHLPREARPCAHPQAGMTRRTTGGRSPTSIGPRCWSSPAKTITVVLPTPASATW